MAAPKTFIADKPGSLNQPASFIPDTPTGLPSINKPADMPERADFSEFSGGLGSPNSAQRVSAQNLSDIANPALKYGGAAVFSAMALPAAAASGPMAPLVETAAGAGGYAIGASLADQLDQLIGIRKPPQTMQELVSRPVENVRQGLEQELTGRIAGAGVEGAVGLAAGGASKLAIGGAEKLRKVSEAAARVGINLTPAELMGTKALGALESVLDNIPWTSSIIQRNRLGELEKLTNLRNKLIAENGSADSIETIGIKIKNIADNYVQKIGGIAKDTAEAVKNRLLDKVGSYSTYADLDTAGKEVAQRFRVELDNKVSTAYDAVRAKIPPTSIDPVNTKNMAQAILAEQESLAVKNPDLIRAAKFFLKDENPVPSEVMLAYQSPATSIQDKAYIEQQFPQLLNPSSAKSYGELADNVKAFNQKKYAQITEAGGSAQISAAGKRWDDMIDAMRSDMDSIASSTGNEELKNAHKIANGLYKQKLAYLEDPAFLRMNENNPGAVTKSILNSREPELIQRYRAIAGENLFSKAKDRLSNDILGISPEQDLILGDDAEKFGSQLMKAGDKIRARILALGESANSIYTPKELDYLRGVANAFDTTGGATNDLLSNPFISKMMKAADMPVEAARSIVAPMNPGAASAIENVFGPSAKKKVADVFFPELLSANQEGTFLPQTFARKFDEFGKPTIEAWYGKEMANKLEDIANVGRRMAGAERVAGKSGTAIPYRSMIGFYEAMRLYNKATTLATDMALGKPLVSAVVSLGKDASFILGTRQLAKLYSSPMGRTLFVDGLITPETAEEAGKIAAKITSIIGNEYLNGRSDSRRR